MNKPGRRPSDTASMTAAAISLPAIRSPLSGLIPFSGDKSGGEKIVGERTSSEGAASAQLVAEDGELAKLVARAKGGDRAAFAELVSATYDRAYTVAFHTMRSPDDARDVVQEAFVRVQRGLPDFQGQSKFTTWLYRVVVNLCLDAMRRKKVAPVATDPLELDATDPRRSPEHVAGDTELAVLLERGLGLLSEAHRVALVLYEIEGLSYDEIAKVTNARIGTVMSRLFHARKKMQAFLRAELKDAAPDLDKLDDGDGEDGTFVDRSTVSRASVSRSSSETGDA